MRSLLVMCALVPVVVLEGEDVEGVRRIQLAGQGLQFTNTIDIVSYYFSKIVYKCR